MTRLLDKLADFMNPGMMSILLNSLRKHNLALFVGSGISNDPPACLPLARELKRSILQILCDDQQGLLRDFFDHLYCSGKNPNILAKKYLDLMPLEVLAQRVFERSKVDVSSLFEQFRFSSPNALHLKIAQLMRFGYIQLIVTTNYDTLIENALNLLGWKRDEDFQVFTTSVPLAEQINCPTIVKFHGTIEEKESIKIMAGELAYGVSQERASGLQSLFKNREFLFLGYSFGDPDVYNIVLNSPRKRIFWVTRRKLMPVTIGNILRGCRPRGLPIMGDLNWVFEEISKELNLGDVHKFLKNSNFDFLDHAKVWASEVTDLDRYHLMGILFSDFGELSLAKRCFQALAKLGDCGAYYGAALHALGVVETGMGNFREATECFEKAKNKAYEINDNFKAATDVYMLALCKRDQGYYAEAKQLSYDTIDILKKVSPTTTTTLALEVRARNLLNELETYLEGKIKIFEHQDSLKHIAHQAGDLSAEALIGLNLYTMQRLTQSQNQVEATINMLHYNIFMAQKLGEFRKESHFVLYLVEALTKIGKLDNAKAMLNNLLSMVEYSGIKQDLIVCEIAMAVVLRRPDMTYPEEAYLHAKRALTLSEEAGYQPLQAKALLLIAEIDFLNGDETNATENIQKGLGIYEKMQDKFSPIFIYPFLAEVEYSKQQFRRAVELLSMVCNSEIYKKNTDVRKYIDSALDRARKTQFQEKNKHA